MLSSANNRFLRTTARTDPETETRNNLMEGPTSRTPEGMLTPGTTQPGNEDWGEPEGRYRMTTEKARALPDTLASTG